MGRERHRFLLRERCVTCSVEVLEELGQTERTRGRDARAAARAYCKTLFYRTWDTYIVVQLAYLIIQLDTKIVHMAFSPISAAQYIPCNFPMTKTAAHVSILRIKGYYQRGIWEKKIVRRVISRF